MKKQILTAALIISGSLGLMAQSTVTILVNMTGQTLDPNGVHIAGSFQSEAGATADWQPGETPMNDEGGGIYSFSSMLPDGTYEFKFINGNDGPMEESIPVESQVGTGNPNRFFVVDGNDLIIPPIYFGQNGGSDGIVELSMVRFSVDMTGSTVAAEGISSAGSWQTAAGGISDWVAGQNKLYDVDPNDNLDVYTGIYYIPSTLGPFEYKFVNGSAFEDVPSGCATNNNRTLVIDGSAVLEKYCFGTCTDVCVELPTYSLTLNVDMNFNCNFQVGVDDSVDVAGTFNGFSGGPAFLMSDDDNDGIFTITLENINSGEVKYKARIIRNADFGSGWEGGGDKIIQLGSDTTMEARCFGSDVLGACAPIPAPSSITFRVDLTDETPAANIFVIGDFTTPAFQNGAIELTPVAPGVYETTVDDICPGSINYKFVNGDVFTPANEESFPDEMDRDCVIPNGKGGFNRTYTRTSADPVTLAYKFNTCQEIVGLEEVVSPISAMYPNPADLSTKIQFASENSSYTVVISDIMGKRIEQVNNVRGSYIVQRGNLSSGIYVVEVTDTKGNTATQKLIFN
ncbi:MAG: T9SS type A sorting domain-containing protein [Bacteroidia bacterium]